MNNKRNGRRKRRDEFEQRRPQLGHYLIVTDTKETEKNYFQDLSRSMPEEIRRKITIRVIITPTGNLVDRCLEEAALAPQYAEAWIIFDRDEVQNFDEIIDEAIKNKLHAGWSNPCFEIWMEAYFGKMESCDTSVQCCQHFAEIFYRKTGSEYKKNNRKIYSALKKYGDEQKAIQLAEAKYNSLRFREQKPSRMYSCTTVYQLIREIIEKSSK